MSKEAIEAVGTTDIIVQLTTMSYTFGNRAIRDICNGAASEIERLRAEVEELREKVEYTESFTP